MTSPQPVWVEAKPGSRLEDLLVTYALLKPQADEIADRLDTVKAAIKAEMAAAAPEGSQKIDVAHEALPNALRLSYVESWRIDTKKLKAVDPATYVRWAVKGGKWELRGVSA